MKIFDAHCDVLYKMHANNKINFYNSRELQVNLKSLKSAGIKIQAFAIYVPENIGNGEKFTAALEMIEIFYEKIVNNYEDIKLIKSAKDVKQLGKGEIGAFLTLEGCDCIGSDLIKLKTLLRLGVRSVGLTWNYANAVADGILEERGGSLSSFGKRVITTLNEDKVSCDVSHLSEAAFWDVIELSDLPFASHSNCYSIMNNDRNLKDDQIKALIEKNGVIGITFVPQFLTSKKTARIAHILDHIDHICSLGGENNVGFGSDFDGISETVSNLETVKEYDKLINELIKRYSSSFIKKICYENMLKIIR